MLCANIISAEHNTSLTCGMIDWALLARHCNPQPLLTTQTWVANNVATQSNRLHADLSPNTAETLYMTATEVPAHYYHSATLHSKTTAKTDTAVQHLGNNHTVDPNSSLRGLVVAEQSNECGSSSEGVLPCEARGTVVL
jgi:hypothetical protein